ncbi:MAG: hypothetical protein IKT03_08285 [Muribaculaceae bacterium]|nr:hypothetical protein [Muribaculaceae bacterium]
MPLLDVSFGIFAFMPQGWLFMMLIILLEAFVMNWVLGKKRIEMSVFVSALAANGVSGILGIIISMILNGGWWLVVWFPWVTSYEVDVHEPKALTGLIIYYVAALVLSVLIEWGINHAILRKRHPARKILKATLYANAASYALGTILLALLCF